MWSFIFSGVDLLKTAGLIKHLVIVGVLGGATVISYNILESGGSEALALQLAPTYIPLSQEAAVAEAKKDLDFSTQKYYRVKERRKSDPCYLERGEYEFSAMRLEMNCRNGLATLSEPIKPSLDVAATLQNHRNVYFINEVKPLQEAIEESGLVVAQVIAGLLAIWAAIVTFKWIVGTALPVSRDGIKAASSNLQISKSVKTMADAHRLNKAKEQIQTLEKLLDSGLITETEFNRRKELLRSSLEG